MCVYSSCHQTKPSQTAAFCPSPSRFESVIYIYPIARTPNQSKPNQAVRPCCPSRVASRVRIHVFISVSISISNVISVPKVSYPYPMSYPCLISIEDRSYSTRNQCNIQPSHTPTLQTQPIRTNPIQTPIPSHNTQPKEPLLPPRRPSTYIPLLPPSTANLPKSPSALTLTLAAPPPRRCRIGHGGHVPWARARRARERWRV